ncbi:pentapeptide repeat-containing protein [Streptomyces sp. TLI_171]|uniref:pentapeptide repeat-containing protein n=1 Tax=Streptomyces sp. TLI_171 TaxID=1938859 RepID=UPI000C1885EE|nr:pentapeptide repeat-containing protein [Streptomyces sp. TLI_171]RKE17648.1 pentapeptide repeat protein [Streptomyces sp. TLI_171]
MTAAVLAPSAPPWPHCGDGASAADPVGCRGVPVGAGRECLRHLPRPARTGYLRTLTAGSALDLRGTPLDRPLLDALRAACTDTATGRPRFGRVDFSGAEFLGDAPFDGAAFTDTAVFTGAVFAGTARFDRAVFDDDAWFDDVVFARDARFNQVVFHDRARFRRAVFRGCAWFDVATFTSTAQFRSAAFERTAWFDAAAFTRAGRFDGAVFRDAAWFDTAAFARDARFDAAVFDGLARFTVARFARTAQFDAATFADTAWFDSAAFAGAARFDAVAFAGEARFDGAVFEGLQHLGPMVGAGRIVFDRARFSGVQVAVEAAAAELAFTRAAFDGSAVLRLRYAELQLNRATLSAPVTVHFWPVPFTGPTGAPLDEGPLGAGSLSAAVRLLDLEGVDVAHLVLTDVDLSRCRFTGAFHLDQIRIGFGCRFAAPPAGWHRRGVLPVRWSRRKVIAEEAHWRALAPGPDGRGWPTGPHHAVPGLGPATGDLAGVYQQLRKAFEEARNEPDAADFYYGEMEMRRHDRQRPRAERRLLGAYWLASGYGLRASRALSGLLAAMGVTLLAMMLFGLPNDSPDPQTTGSYADGAVRVTTRTPDPVLTLPLRRRVTAARAEKAALVVVNSVVFRSSGQNLTLTGTVVEMASRIGEPVLLGLAALAVRSRVKR